MLRRLFQLVAVACPIGLFALALEPVQQRMYGGHGTQGILLLLGALVLLAVVEGLIFRYWILPCWSEKLAERLYSGSYVPGDDSLAQLVDRIEQEKDASLMPELENVVMQQRWRLRGWLELARLQQELQHDAIAALSSLEKATHYIKAPEDAALLMYRAAQLCEKSMNDTAAARLWLQRAVDSYPDTVYGRRAAARLL